MPVFAKLLPRLLAILSVAGVVFSASGADQPAKPSPQAPPLPVAQLPTDSVLVEICEAGVPQENVWPSETVAATERYTIEAFGLSRLPHKYIDTGIRADRPPSFLVRAAAQVPLPAGKHRLLLRGRGASRLYIDGQLLLTLPFRPGFTNGHNPIRTDYLDLAPDFRFAPPGNRERWTTFVSPGQTHIVLLETIVGGGSKESRFRPELGETVVAIAHAGAASFELLAPQKRFPYNDAGWKDYAEAEEKWISQLEAERRAQARQREAAREQQQREAARRWLAETPEVPVPALPPDFPAHNAIDHFLAARIVAAQAGGTARGGTLDYQQTIRPLLESRCFSCHQGAKAKGGLRLDTSQAARQGGASGQPVVVPGKPEASLLLQRITAKDRSEVMPPRGDRLTDREIELLRQWIREGATYTSTSEVGLTALTDDLTFLRRVTLDTVGVVPTESEISRFLATPPSPSLGKGGNEGVERRRQLIDQLLADPRWADHHVGYWQDVLAENPNILNPTLNNTGPFRWWIYESLLDNKPLDLFARELVNMRGSLSLGGPAGFAMASENDVPMAEKAIIVAAAFLGISMKCARCHDAPAHQSTQRDLFQLAALLNQGPIQLPRSSSVPVDKLHAGARQPLISVTLKPGARVAPAWPFQQLVSPQAVAGLVADHAPPRERLAALLTAPANERFAQVLANRIWKRLMGRGLMEPVDDWEKGELTHPDLLRYLGRELVRSGYDQKHLYRLILNSHAYQRAADPNLKEPDPLFRAPARRRLEAEQIVDSLFLATGKQLDTEEVNLDVDGGRDVKNSTNLGKPRRAWQLASTSNERDRPSLSLPRVQAVVDLLETFGWRSARQDALSVRESAPNALQPALLANGTVGLWLTRLSEDHGITELALQEQPLETLVDRLFARILTRPPRPEERAALTEYLRDGYGQRIVRPVAPAEPRKRQPPRYVSWSNHLTPEANEIKRELEQAARRGDPPTQRLEPRWRQRLEDVLWSLLNAPEFVFTP